MIVAPGQLGYVGLALAIIVAGWAILGVSIRRGLPGHPHARFGLANTITAARAAIAVAVAATIPMASGVAPDSQVWWIPLAAVTVALILDGVDGRVARATGQHSAFGARFDMEVDAFLALVVAVLVWQLGKGGVWVLALGALRYAFVAAGFWFSRLTAPLFASTRRKVICVVQIASLAAMLMPVLSPPLTSLIGIVALMLLSFSFLRDTVWLLRTPRVTPPVTNRPRWSR